MSEETNNDNVIPMGKDATEEIKKHAETVRKKQEIFQKQKDYFRGIIAAKAEQSENAQKNKEAIQDAAATLMSIVILTQSKETFQAQKAIEKIREGVFYALDAIDNPQSFSKGK